MIVDNHPLKKKFLVMHYCYLNYTDHLKLVEYFKVSDFGSFHFHRYDSETYTTIIYLNV